MSINIFFRLYCSVSCFIYRGLLRLGIIVIAYLSFLDIANAQQLTSALETLPLPEIGEYRSVKDGDWNDASTWQEWTGNEWSSASTFPSETSRITPLVAAWNSSTKTGGGTEHVIALPDEIEEGDLILIFWTSAQVGGGSVGAPTGFSMLYTDGSNNKVNRRRLAWYKFATGKEGKSISVRNVTGASAHVTYRIAAGTYDGIPVVPTTPVIIGNNTSPDPPALNSGFGSVPTLWIASSHSDGDVSTSGPPSYPDPIIAYTGSEGNEGTRTATAHMITTSELSQNPGIFTLDSDRNWAANTIAIRGGIRSAIIQNNHTVTVTNNLEVTDVEVYGILNVNTNTAMAVYKSSALAVCEGGRLRLPGNNLASYDARIEGDGSFLLSEGAYLEIGSRNGITSSGAMTTSGNIRNTTSGMRIFHPGAHYIYNRIGLASKDQDTGTGYPTNLTGSLTIDNPNSVKRTTGAGASYSRTISTGTLYLLQGNFIAGTAGFIIGSSKSAVNGTVVRREGILTGGVGSNWYQVIYEGNSKTTGPELLGSGLRNLIIDLVDRTQIIELNGNTIVPGTLTLTTGLVNTGSNKLTVSSDANDAILGGSASSFVQGTLIRSIARGANTYIFPLGSGGRYAPVNFAFTANSTTRNVTGSTTGSNHERIGDSHLKDPGLERHWTFSADDVGTYKYNSTFSWDNADEEEGFDSNDAIVAMYSGSTWTYPTMVDKTVSAITATGLTVLGDFQVASQDMAPVAEKSRIEIDRNSDVVANNSDASTITVTVCNANGDPVATGVDVFFKITNGNIGDGSLVPSASWKTNEDGQVRVNLTSTVANRVGVTAYLGTDATGEWIGDTELNATVEVTFKAGEATKLIVAAQPIASGASGSVLIEQPVIHILDANGNVVADNSTTEVIVGILSGNGGDLGGIFSVIAEKGVATFDDLTLSGKVGEVYRLNFFSDGLTAVVSDEVSLGSHGSLRQIVLSGSVANLPSGDSRVLIVTLKDAAGNIVDTGVESSSEIVFSQSVGPGSVSGLTVVAAENGIALLAIIGEKAGQLNIKASAVSPTLTDELRFTITVEDSILQNMLGIAEGLIETDWSTDSWTALLVVIENAQAVLSNANSSQSDINDVLAALNFTLEALVVDKAALIATIAEAVTKIEEDWSPISWGVFLTAFTNAEGVLDDVESTQLGVDIALAALNTAIVELAVDKTALQSVVAETEDLIEANWSIDSWTTLQFAISKARMVLDDINTKQSKINVTLSELEDVIDALDVDKSALEAVVVMVLGLIEIDYSSDSWVVLQIAISEARMILDDTNAKQSEIEVVLIALNKAIDDLESVVSTIIGIEDELPIFETIYGTAFEDIDGLKDLPLNLLVVLSSGEIELVGVKWELEDYNLAVLGEYTLLGKLVLPAAPTFTNVDDLMAEVKVTVNPKPLTVKVDNKAKVYGQGDPELTYTVSTELVGGDAFTGVLVRTAGESFGTYAIKQGTLALNGNYQLNFISGNLTIQKAQASIIADERQEYEYDGTVKNVIAKLNHGETTLDYSPQQGYTNAGSYTIEISAEETANHLGTYKRVTLIINRGQPVDKPVLKDRTVTYDGKAHSLEVENLPEGASVAYDNNGQTDAGTYEVTARISYPHYVEETITAVLTIRKAGQRIEFREVGRLLREVGQVELEVSTDSGLPVGLHSSDELVATIAGRDLLVHRLGTTRITAMQEGDKNHEPADPVTITVTVEDATGDDPVRVHQALSPNGDGINDFLILEGIKDYPYNKLTVLTRNGIRVFTIDNYDNESRVFKGFGNFNSSGGTLPEGTYFYVLEYKEEGSWKVRKGWLVLKM